MAKIVNSVIALPKSLVSGTETAGSVTRAENSPKILNPSFIIVSATPTPTKSLFSQILDGTVESMSEADFDENLTQIASYRFAYFSNIKSVTIPNHIQNLGNGFCLKCPNLESLTLGTGITSIGSGFVQFTSTKKLKSITIYAETPPTLGSQSSFGMDSLQTIYVPASSVDAYKAATNWSAYAEKIQAIV